MKKLLFLTVPLIMVGAMALTNKGTDANYAEFDIIRPVQPSHIDTSGIKDHISDFASISFSKPDFSTSFYRPLKKYKYEDIEEGKSYTGTYAQFQDIADEHSYLGFGYDVINDPYIDSDYVKMRHAILDMNKIQNASLKLDRKLLTHAKTFENTRMDEFAQDYGASLSVYGNYAKVFSGGLKAEYHGSSYSKEFYYFYKGVFNIRTFTLRMLETDESVKNMLSAEFVSDLNSSSVSPAELFNKYGTHLILGASMGGRAEVNETYSSEETAYTNEVKVAINTHIKYVGSSINVEASGEYSNDLKRQNINDEFEGKTVGGPSYGFHDLNSFFTYFPDWANALNEDLSWSGLMGIPSPEYFLPIWNFVEDNNQTRKEQLEDYFVEAADDSFDDLCSQFITVSKRKVTVNVTDDEGNANTAAGQVQGNQSVYKVGDVAQLTAVPNRRYAFYGWYDKDGNRVSSSTKYSFVVNDNIELEARFCYMMDAIDGYGTYSDPYLLKKPDDFYYVRFDMDGIYKLANNIDFKKAEIDPIPGTFNGQLNGNGKKITNYRITRYYNGNASWTNLGLFESIGGQAKIYDLIMNDCYITVTSGNNNYNVIYAGILCGTNLGGTIDNCDFSGDKVNVENKFSLIGIVTGYSRGIIKNCDLKTIQVRGWDVVGGITGTSDTTESTIENCTLGKYWNSGKNVIELNAGDNYAGTYRAGGFCGYGYRTSIKNCSISDTNFTLKGSAANNPAIGVFIGYMYGGTLEYKKAPSGIGKKNEISNYSKYYFAYDGGLFGLRDGGTVTKK